MRVLILAGGFGTRISEVTEIKPKPMVEIGGRPILWHIMKHYSAYDFHEFVIALGYKADMIKRYFLEYASMAGNITLEISKGRGLVTQREEEEWVIHLEETGLDTMTGGRVKKVKDWLKDGTFMVTYGDGVSDVDIDSLLKFHRSHGKLATITAVRPPARFGGLALGKDNIVQDFVEKPKSGEGYINGGFMVLEPAVVDMIPDFTSSLESDLLEKLATEGQLMAYCHDGFWQCMDTLRDLKYLENLWNSGKAPWKTW